jgi:hypothetical protein
MPRNLFFRIGGVAAVLAIGAWFALRHGACPFPEGEIPSEIETVSGGAYTEVASLMNPKEEVLDLHSVIKVQCTETLPFTILQGEVVGAIRHPPALRLHAEKVRQCLDGAYSGVRDLTGLHPNASVDYVLINLPEVPRNHIYSFPSSSTIRLQEVLIWRGSPEDEHRNEMFFESARFEASRKILSALLASIELPREKIYWFEIGFSRHFAAKIAGAESRVSGALTSTRVLEILENPTVRERLLGWKFSHEDRERLDVWFKTENENAIVNFWKDYETLAEASRGVFQAIDTIGGEDFCRNLLKDLRFRESFETPTMEEFFAAIRKNTGCDIRDWDAFTRLYRETVEEIERLPLTS